MLCSILYIHILGLIIKFNHKNCMNISQENLYQSTLHSPWKSPEIKLGVISSFVLVISNVKVI